MKPLEMFISLTFLVVMAGLFLKDAPAANLLTGGLTNAYTSGVGALGSLGGPGSVVTQQQG